jgi:ribose transport system permease protein
MSTVDASRARGIGALALFRANLDRRSAVATVVPMVVLAIELAYFFGRSPASFGRTYLLNDLSTAMPLILVGTGQAIVIISGGIDISVGGTVSLVSAIAATTFTSSDLNVLGWSVVLVLLGLGIGAVNGFLIGVLGLSPVIVTIATWSITGGLAIVVLQAPGGNISTSDIDAWTASPLYIPSPVLILALLFVVWFVLRRSSLGPKLYAIGSDPEAAAVSGVRVQRAQWASYALCGGLAAVAALFTVAFQASGDPNAGTPLILDSIAAVVVGGIPISGGRGGIVNVVIGALIYTMVGFIITVSNISTFLVPLFTGAILVLVVAASSLVSLLANRRAVRG